MAKSHNQKAKILFLAQMLRETGENRVLTMQEILSRLNDYGIQAERKSIYDDFEALRDFGMDITFKRGRNGGYYVAGQSLAEGFSTAEETETEAGTVFFSAESDSGKKPMKLLCSAGLEEQARQYFGERAEYKSKGIDGISITTDQRNDPMFFGWLTTMGSEIHIVKPKKLAQAYREYLKSIVREYKGL